MAARGHLRSATGRTRFRRARFRAASSVSFLALTTLSFLSLFFWKTARKTAKKTRIFYPHRTPKIPGKEGKRSKKTRKSSQQKKKNKEFQKKTRKGRTGQVLGRELSEFLSAYYCLCVRVSNRKNPHAHRNKTGTSTPLGMGVLRQKEPKNARHP